MKIILANPRGFCAGVHMAIDVVDQLLNFIKNPPIYVYHEIVHNQNVVKRLEKKGVIFVEDISDIPKKSIVVFSAHGVSPLIREQAKFKQLDVVDATCPLVTKVHAEAIRYSKKGMQILLIGHRNHQEVIGTMGEAPKSVIVIENCKEATNVQVKDKEKLAYLTQTTLSTDDAKEIISILKKRFPQIHSPPGEDICYATTNRQNAVRQLAPKTDLVLVVGSKNSSNSKRLVEISLNQGTPGKLIDDLACLDPKILLNKKSILVTAGASAPEDLVLELVVHISKNYNAKIEQHTLLEEKVEFGLPASLKKIMKKNKITPKGKSIIVDTFKTTSDFLASRGMMAKEVNLTISSKINYQK